MKKAILIAMISLLAVWSCQKENEIALKSVPVTKEVKSGDTLWKIASKYKGVTPEEIMKWNKCGAKIRPGQKLKIYKS